MRSILASLLQITGIGAVSFGAWTLAPWAGYIVAGVGLFAIGYVLDLPSHVRPGGDS